ncbi:MAG TPA: hypothetical protein DCF47_02500, partial [Kandleria vitulina]|nr:hypothetical protein [Kandleria vitulina]
PMLKRDLQIQGRLVASDFFGILKLKENTAVTFAVMNIKKMCTYLARLEEKCAQKQNFEHQSDEVKKLVGVL